MSEDVISNMRERMHKLRRISTYVTDQKALEALKAMVAEIEADIRRLEAGEPKQASRCKRARPVARRQGNFSCFYSQAPEEVNPVPAARHAPRSRSCR